MFQTKVVEKIKTYILCSVAFFFFENRAVYEIMWKNTVQLDRPQITIRRTRIIRWKPKAANTHSDYVILTAFLLQKWLRARASMLRYSTPSVLLLLICTRTTWVLSCFKICWFLLAEFRNGTSKTRRNVDTYPNATPYTKAGESFWRHVPKLSIHFEESLWHANENF